MKCYESTSGGRVLVIRLNRGDLLRESIEQALKDHDINDGCIVSGYGTLETCTLHMINTLTEFPAKEDFVTWDHHPLELLSLTGVIADGIPHIHAVVSDKDGATGGHLEMGCSVAYLAEVVVYEHAGLSLMRAPTDEGPLALIPKS